MEPDQKRALFDRFGIAADNPGACAGPGQWRGGGARIASFNPANEQTLAYVTLASADDVAAVIASAASAARAWRDIPAPRRGEAVRRFGNLLREHKDALGTLVSLENGKIKAEGDGEVQEMIDIADFAVGQSRMLYGKSMHSERAAHRMYEQWHPLGVVGVISAFNFPVAVWAWNAMLAAICGNATVWKPSPKTPLAALAVQSLANRVMSELSLPPIFALAIAGNAETRALVADPRIALVSFTGSSAVGRDIATSVASRFGKSLLECAGNNAIIVAEDADLDLVVPAVVFGAVGTAGQRCTTTRRLIVHESRIDQLLGQVEDRLRAGAHRRPAGTGDADGTAHRCRRSCQLPMRPSPRPPSRAARWSAAAACCPVRDSGWSRRSSAARATSGRASSARRSRRSCT